MIGHTAFMVHSNLPGMCACMNLICQHRRLRWCHLAQPWHPDGVSGRALINWMSGLWFVFFFFFFTLGLKSVWTWTQKLNLDEERKRIKTSWRAKVEERHTASSLPWRPGMEPQQAKTQGHHLHRRGKGTRKNTPAEGERGHCSHTRQKKWGWISCRTAIHWEPGERERGGSENSWWSSTEKPWYPKERTSGDKRERWTERLSQGLDSHGCRSTNKQRVGEMQRFSESLQYYCWPCWPRYLRSQCKKLHF